MYKSFSHLVTLKKVVLRKILEVKVYRNCLTNKQYKILYLINSTKLF